VDQTRAKGYLFAAARCRKAASTSRNPKEWIALAEQWEFLVEAQQLLRSESKQRPLARLDAPRPPSNKGEPSSGKTNGSSAPGFHDPLDWVP
jgi:hypothetical protein